MRNVIPLFLLLGAGCAPPSTTAPGYQIVFDDPAEAPLRGASVELVRVFNEGDAIFGEPFRESQGLGPLFIRQSCASCHSEGLRGPGTVQKMVVVVDDGVTPSPDQSALAFEHTVRPYVAAGAETPVEPPADLPLKVTTRLPPSVLGRGYVEAVLDSEIERVAAEQAARTDGISGRVNRVPYTAATNPGGGFHDFAPAQPDLIGRFGHKAIHPSLDDSIARALQLDIGVTSPLRPQELPNPDALDDDDKPGVDVDADVVQSIANYVRLLEIPARGEGNERGRELFTEVKCAVCHVPSLRTRPDYPFEPLADIDAPIYSDLLLHDRGPEFDDGLAEEGAATSEWKTPPLIGLRFMRAHLHDGSAHSVDEVIAAHAAPESETAVAADLFYELDAEDQAALIAFVESL